MENIENLKLSISNNHIYTMVLVKELGHVDFYSDMIFRKRLVQKK